MEYIASQRFTDVFTSSERANFAEKYADTKWEYAKYYLNYNRRISKSAIKVAEVLKIKLGIELFPLIIPVACKGFDMRGGTASFYMISSDEQEYLFECRAYQITLRGTFYIREHKGRFWVGREK